MKYYETIPNLIAHIETDEFEPKSLLGEDFHEPENLTQSDKEILE